MGVGNTGAPSRLPEFLDRFLPLKERPMSQSPDLKLFGKNILVLQGSELFLSNPLKKQDPDSFPTLSEPLHGLPRCC